MENTIQQLIKIITILYFNDKADDTNENIFDEVNKYLREIKIDARAIVGLGDLASVIEALRYTAEWMVHNNEGKYDRKLLLQRLTINCQGNNDYVEIAKLGLDENITSVDARKKVINLLLELRYDKKKNDLKNLIASLNAKLNFNNEYWEIGPTVTDLMTKLDDLQVTTKNEIPGLVGEVDFTNSEFIEKALNKGIELSDVEGLLNTGDQYLNYTSGGGFKRGFLINFNALTHHYKSGQLIDLSLNIPIYNNPWMWDQTKKPMILRISFENTIDQDIIIIYKKLYELTYKKAYDLTEVNIDEASKFLKDYFQQNGYTFHIQNYNPSNFCIYDLFNLLNKYINAGYEIHAVICDYLELITDNTYGDRKDSKISKTYEMVRCFCYPKGITFITAAQLDTEAKNYYNYNKLGFLDKVCDGGYNRDCKSLHHKLDLDYTLCIIRHSDSYTYLGRILGKNRGTSIIPTNNRKAYHRFEFIGGIIPDIDMVYSGMKEIPNLVNANDNIDCWE